jgi:hypothetical protein
VRPLEGNAQLGVPNGGEENMEAPAFGGKKNFLGDHGARELSDRVRPRPLFTEPGVER